MSEKPILIVGADVCGLALAQACRKREIPFLICDRDTVSTDRDSRWIILSTSALESLSQCLPEDIVALLPGLYIGHKGDTEDSSFFDLTTGEAKWRIHTSPKDTRISHSRLQSLFSTGIDIQRSKALKSIECLDTGIRASFEDGTSIEGCVLVGADGSHSNVRALCHPDAHENYQLPVRALSARAWYSDDEIQSIRQLHPYKIQGSSPKNDVFMQIDFPPSTDAPGDSATEPTSAQTDKHLCQSLLSWPYRENWLGRADPTNCPNAGVIQFALMKTMSEDFAEYFKSIVHTIPREAEIREVVIEDYLPQRTNAFGGRVVLVGDAAHVMAMFRDESFDCAIADVADLVAVVEPLIRQDETDGSRWRAACEKYDREMVERNRLEVLASRQACLDAHQSDRLDDESPLIRQHLDG